MVLTESGNGAAVEALSLQFRLTAREAEVLYWVAQGKTNRDIGDILGTQPEDGHQAPGARVREAGRRDAHGGGGAGDRHVAGADAALGCRHGQNVSLLPATLARVDPRPRAG